ncbi:MAG: ABC transporter ATP-binding protein [Candidatus Omnitrophota bacterium]
MSYIKIEQLSKSFTCPLSFGNLLCLNLKHRPVSALKDVSFSLNKGEMLGILGPNGAGKTTLLKIISSLILPDKGAATIGGYCLGRDDAKIKSIIGLVSSAERSFYWRLTGRQNLEFFAVMYGLNRKQIQTKTTELFSLLEIDSAQANKRFDSYSTGMRQKFSLVRALLSEPEILLLDEPSKSLDYKTASDFRNFIKEHLVKQQGKTVVFTTHHMDEALEFGKQFMILDKGKVLALGTLDELRKNIANQQASLAEIFMTLTQK